VANLTLHALLSDKARLLTFVSSGLPVIRPESMPSAEINFLQADIGTDSVESRFDHFRTSDHSSAISLTFYVLLSAKMSYFPFSLSGPLSP
jgi:hypothetical protein